MVTSAIALGVAAHAAAQPPTTRVVVAEALLVDARPTITLVGTVEPVRRSRVGSQIPGIVIEMPARQGDLIEQDGLLCQLNDDTLKLQLTAEQAMLAALRAHLEALQAGTRAQELKRLKALLDEAAAELERWEFEMQRIEKLYADRDSNDKEYFDTKAGYLAARRRKAGTEAAYNLGLEGPRKETIAEATYAVAGQQAVVDRVSNDLSKTSIRAPFTGYVVRRSVEVGEWIPEGGAVVEMVDLSSVLVRMAVPESVLPFLKVSDKAGVRIDALKRSFDGRIKHIMRQADRTARTFPVEVEVANPEGALAGGMFAKVTVPAGAPHKTVAVPKDAVVQRDGVSHVGVVVPGHQGGTAGMLVPVTVGLALGHRIAITSGNIRPGTSVITRGTERILPFPAPIEIVDEMGTPVASPLGDRKSAPVEGT